MLRMVPNVQCLACKFESRSGGSTCATHSSFRFQRSLNLSLSAALVVLGAVSSSFAQGSGPQFSIETRTFVQIFPSALGRISNIPASFRTIPGHSGDSNAGLLITVPADTISPGLFSGLYAGVAPQLRVRGWRFRGGPQFGMYSSPQPQKVSTGNTRELNQFGTQQRGTGTALVYYAVVPRANPFSGGYGEIEHSVGSKIGLIAGYAWSPYDYTVKTGYDRYDSLESFQIYTLGTADMHRFYGGLEIGGRTAFLLLAGAGKQQISVGSGASGTEIKAPSITSFLSIGVTYRIGSTH